MQTITITPTWTSLMPVLIAALQSGTEVGKAQAKSELMDLARILDALDSEKNTSFLLPNQSKG